MIPLICLAALLPAALQQPVRADRDARMANAALTVAVERIPLPALKGAVSLSVQALLSEVELAAPSDAPVLAQSLKRSAGALCPQVELRGARVALTCRTRRIEANLVEEGGRRYLDLRQLRGLPYLPAEDGPPAFSYEPRAVGIGGPCPGTTPASRGECRLAAGATLEAAALFKDALSTGERAFAAMRLGDLALVAHDPGTAVGWYQRCGPRGVFGRMANARLCELTGDCAGKPGEAYFAVGLPEPLGTEMELRAVRAAALNGLFGEAASKLAARLGSVVRPPACARAPLLCRRIALAALRQARPEEVPAAMALYVALPSRDKGPLALDLRPRRRRAVRRAWRSALRREPALGAHPADPDRGPLAPPAAHRRALPGGWRPDPRRGDRRLRPLQDRAVFRLGALAGNREGDLAAPDRARRKPWARGGGTPQRRPGRCRFEEGHRAGSRGPSPWRRRMKPAPRPRQKCACSRRHELRKRTRA